MKRETKPSYQLLWYHSMLNVSVSFFSSFQMTHLHVAASELAWRNLTNASPSGLKKCNMTVQSTSTYRAVYIDRMIMIWFSKIIWFSTDFASVIKKPLYIYTVWENNKENVCNFQQFWMKLNAFGPFRLFCPLPDWDKSIGLIFSAIHLCI